MVWLGAEKTTVNYLLDDGSVTNYEAAPIINSYGAVGLEGSVTDRGQYENSIQPIVLLDEW